jgi:hypothetical protein
MASLAKVLTDMLHNRYPDPPAMLQWLVDTGLTARKLVLRHLTLPRPTASRKQLIADDVNSYGKIQRLVWDAEPW